MNKKGFKEIPITNGDYSINETGLVINNKTGENINITKNGNYLRCSIKVDGKSTPYRIHQLMAITFLNHKPNGHKIVVDHIDNNQLNNNLSNLQLISTYQNTIKNNKKGTSKYVGVSLLKKGSKRWRARTKFNGKHITIGHFNTELEASKAYKDKIKELHNG